jgi:hypothetical protein
VKLILKKRQKVSGIQGSSVIRRPDIGDLNPAQTVNVISAERTTPDAIKTAFCSVPLLQRREVACQFEGLRVQWEGKVYSLEMLQAGKVKIEIKWRNSTIGIFFVVDPNKYKGLGILKRGDVLTVDGEIERVSEFYISLNDAKLVSGADDRSSNTD